MRTAILLEKAFRKDSRFPESFPLPPDPCDVPAGTLHYKLGADAHGYTLWSVGRNGRDDGGRFGSDDADDLVIEHVSTPSPK